MVKRLLNFVCLSNNHGLSKFLCGLTVLSLLLNGTGLAPVLASEPISAKLTYSSSNYELGPGDILSYYVYRSPELSQEKILVRPDGIASFRGVGEVHVNGKTLAQLQTILEERLSVLIRKPIVTVGIEQTRPGIVYLTGAVTSPGMYEFATSSTQSGSQEGHILRTDFRLSNILSNAGGLKMNADLGNIEVRSANGNEPIKVNLWNLLENGAVEEDVIVHPGDTIYVPELSEMALDDENYETLLSSTVGPKTFPVRVVGSLNHPGLVELDGKSPYLNTAIAKAGGYLEGANLKTVAIRRRVKGEQLATIYINPEKADITLRPNDVVYVINTGLTNASNGGTKISKIFAPFGNVAAIAFAIRYFTRP